MGFRFRRSVRVLPGVRLNISKSGVSTSVGRRGATLNISEGGTKTTIGLPGSGLSWQSPTRPWQRGSRIPALTKRVVLIAVLVVAVVAVFLLLKAG
jgi:hypothetical protein